MVISLHPWDNTDKIEVDNDGAINLISVTIFYEAQDEFFSSPTL